MHMRFCISMFVYILACVYIAYYTHRHVLANLLGMVSMLVKTESLCNPLAGALPDLGSPYECISPTLIYKCAHESLAVSRCAQLIYKP